jgi:hypothetical protein
MPFKFSKDQINLTILVLGHADNSITTGRYDSGEWDLEQLADAVNKLPVRQQIEGLESLTLRHILALSI